MPRSIYTSEQKAKAVELALSTGTPQIARLLQINYKTLSKWIRQYKKHNGLELIQKKPYSLELREKAIKQVMDDGRDVKQVVINLDVHERSLQRWLSQRRLENGVSPKPKRKYPPKLKTEAVERVINGHESATSIAKDLKIHKRSLQHWLHQPRLKNDLPSKPKRKQSIHSPELKAEAIERVINGHESAVKVAKDMGVPRKTVSGWVLKYKKEGS